MEKHIIFFLAEDDLSYSIAAILDELIGELDGGVKLSSQRYLGAILTELKIALRPNFARRCDTLKVIVYSISELYKERYKPVSYTHLRAHETEADLVCRLLLGRILCAFPSPRLTVLA